MWEIYFDTYVVLMYMLLCAGAGILGVAIENKSKPPFLVAMFFFLLAGLVHFKTPTEEKMLTNEYNDIKAARPACAAVIDKNIDSASLDCLREYKKYLKDSVTVAKSYYDHLSELKNDLKR